MSFFDLLFGKPLATSAEHDEHIGVAAGVPIFGLDGLTSAAYGPEAAMVLLVPLGIAGVQQHLLPIFTAILALLVILYFSYRQTIEAYPTGGGSFTVASENLGDVAGLLAAAALMIDYILTAAVGVSAGVTALVSAIPALHPHQLGLCLFVLAIIVIVNLRGVKESGIVFMLPTILFVGTLLATIAVGVFRALSSGGHPIAVAAPPPPPPAFETFTKFALVWLLLKAFSNGCAAMTGVEAVSNGVTAFREPRAKRANQTLTVIIFMLMILLIGLSYVAKAYGVTAMDPDASNYQSVLSIEVAAVFGRSWFYFLTMGGVLAALSFSANTAFAGFPRMARAIALKDYLPHVFLLRGRRLLFSHGIYALTGFTALILILFDGVTDRLIPLYAIGAFLAFTLSQAGMVKHWMKSKDATAPTIQAVPERPGRDRDRYYVARRTGDEVHPWRLGGGDPGAAHDRRHGQREAALQTREGRDGRPDAAATERARAADRGDPDGAVGQDRREGDALRDADEPGGEGRARGLQRGARFGRVGLGEFGAEASS